MAGTQQLCKRSAFYVAAFVVCAFASGAAYSQMTQQQLTESAACGIQQALLKSPGEYVIAVVVHPGAVDCLDGPCKEPLKIVRMFASRTNLGRKFSDQTLNVEAAKDSRLLPEGFRSFVVATPVPFTSLYYLPITHGPVDKLDERNEEAAVRLAFGPPIGALCKKTLPASFRLLRSKSAPAPEK
jgi:hypothetical protein